MLIPSIDLMDGQAVQLVGGKEKVLEAGDPLPIAEKLKLAGEIAVIDLDAALGRGSNAAVIERLIRIAPCRVGGGIRDVAAARRWLHAGARKVILGTRAVPEVLQELPADRVIAALDAVDGEVVVDGWREKTGRKIEDRLGELHGLVSGYLITFVEREGRLGGTALDRVEPLIQAAKGRRITFAGGITRAEEITHLDRLGADAQVGMALYTGVLDFAGAIAAPLQASMPDGPWPTILVDEHGVALGHGYSDIETLRYAVDKSRGAIKVGGSTEMSILVELDGIDVDCARETLRLRLRALGSNHCHQGTRTCFGDDHGLPNLSRRLASRKRTAPEGSYTRRLLEDSELLRSKLIEEAGELAEARKPEHVAAEAADVIYFALVALARADVPLSAVEEELDRRALHLDRRPGDAKPAGEAPRPTDAGAPNPTDGGAPK